MAYLDHEYPFWLAKQAATIDQLSNGRLVLALGVGAYREEFAAWAPRLAPKAQRGEMMDEGLELLQRLFNERRVTHQGKYYAVQDIEMYPKPRRQPFALWLGGHNKPTIERTARMATGWLPGWRTWGWSRSGRRSRGSSDGGKIWRGWARPTAGCSGSTAASWSWRTWASEHATARAPSG